MRKEFGKVLRTSFSGKMRQFLPDYKEVKLKTQYVWPGQRTYCRELENLVSLWIVLSPSPKDYDEFTVMVGWSVFGRYPELSVIPSPVSHTSKYDEFSESEYLIRLPQLWTSEDEWWVVKEFEPLLRVEQVLASMQPISDIEAKQRVIPKVESAFEKLIEMGIPYLDRFATHKFNSIG